MSASEEVVEREPDYPDVEIIDRKSVQIGQVTVTTTFGRITPRKPARSRSESEA